MKNSEFSVRKPRIQKMKDFVSKYSSYSQAKLQLLLNDAIDSENWKKAKEISDYIK